MNTAIEFENLAKAYQRGGKRALDGISFSVEQGEIFGFLGPNGAGKTTAIHLLLNFLFPTSGGSRIFGIDSSSPRSRERIGFLPEIFAFDGFLQGGDFLRVFGKLGHRERDEIERRTPELLDFLNMPDASNVKIRNYSKGMTQKIGLAQALIADPDLLILDEPTSGMDPIAKAKIKQLFLRLRSEGKTIFLSSHILSDIEDIADRVAIINEGKLLAISKISELRKESKAGYKISYSGGDDHLRQHLSARVSVKEDDGTIELSCSDGDSRDFALKALLENHADIISVKPTGAGLQSHFLRLVDKEGLADD